MDIPTRPSKQVTFTTTKASVRLTLRKLFRAYVRGGLPTLLPAYLIATVMLMTTSQFVAIAVSWLLLFAMLAWVFFQITRMESSLPLVTTTTEILDDGMLVSSDDGWWFTGWPVVDEVATESDCVLITCRGLRQVNAIPFTAFDSPSEAKAFAESIRQLLKESREGNHQPRLVPPTSLSNVTVNPKTSPKFRQLLLLAVIALIGYLINAEVARHGGIASSVIGVIHFLLIVFLAYRVIKLAPFEPAFLATRRQLSNAPLVISLLDDGVHTLQGHLESLSYWTATAGAEQHEDVIDLMTATGLNLLQIPVSAFNSLAGAQRFVEISNQRRCAEPSNSSKEHARAEQTDQNPYAPPLTEATAEAPEQVDNRVIEYELNDREFAAGINEYSWTTAMGLGAIVFFLGVALPQIISSSEPGAIQSPLLVIGSAFTGLTLAPVMFFASRTIVHRKTRKRLCETPLFAPGKKRLAYYGKTLWLQCSDDEHPFRLPELLQHGHSRKRIVLQHKSALLIVPRSAVSQDDYEYLVASLKRLGMKVK